MGGGDNVAVGVAGRPRPRIGDAESANGNAPVGDTQPVVGFMHDRGGRDTVFRLPDGQVARTGAAGTRCFRDISAQFSEDDALTTAEAAIALMPEIDRETPGIRRPQVAKHEIAVVAEAFLVAGGLAHERAHELAQRPTGRERPRPSTCPRKAFGPHAGRDQDRRTEDRACA